MSSNICRTTLSNATIFFIVCRARQNKIACLIFKSAVRYASQSSLLWLLELAQRPRLLGGGRRLLYFPWFWGCGTLWGDCVERWVSSLGAAECEAPTAEPVSPLASLCPWLSALRCSIALFQSAVLIQEGLQGQLRTENIQVTKTGF